LATVLSAVENEAVSLPGIDPFHDRADELLSAELLNETVGYIRLSTFHSAEVDSEEAEEAFIDEVAEGFADQLQALINAGATELILDLRGNEGGFDSLGARIASHFNSEDALYQTTVPFDLEEGWAEDPDDFDYLWTTPQSPQFGGRVVVLANHTTTSAGETFVEHLQAKEQTRYVGLWGTNGSNADLGGLALLPDGIIVFWPIEPCLTAEGEIRIDTRADLAARLTPDVPLAHTAENFHTAFDDGEDIEVQAALHVLDDPLFAYFSQSEKIAAGWWEDPLYGRYWTGATPWLYHVDFGWIYPSGRGGREQTFYHASWQWCWTSRTNFPWVYSHTLGWLYYIDGWYWTATTGEWQSL
jgi:carboxyl-terminal processing protease